MQTQALPLALHVFGGVHAENGALTAHTTPLVFVLPIQHLAHATLALEAATGAFVGAAAAGGILAETRIDETTETFVGNLFMSFGQFGRWTSRTFRTDIIIPSDFQYDCRNNEAHLQALL